MTRAVLVVAVLSAVLTGYAPPGRTGVAGMSAELSGALTLHASFDTGLDADFSRGDKTCYVPSGKELVRARPNADVTVAAGEGRFGGGDPIRAAGFVVRELGAAAKPGGPGGP
jgi:hypothetical protein